ncbi:MAG: hypothetical protein ABEK36_03510 [Candidatus Aenigmatarchaeota archaeon]
MLNVEKKDYDIKMEELESDLYFCQIPIDFSDYAEKLGDKLPISDSLEKARNDIKKYFGMKSKFSEGFRSVDVELENLDPRYLDTGTLEVIIDSNENLLKSNVKNEVDQRIKELNQSSGPFARRNWEENGTLDIECLLESHFDYR